MTQTAAAKAIAATLRALVPACKEANIIIFMINHITQKVEINPMMHSKSQTIYLKNTETLPRGVTPIYLANTVIRIDDATKLKDGEGFGVAGAITTFSLVKSRSARANSATKMVFDQNKGFDPELSMYLYLKDNGYVNGAGVSYYLGDNTEYKFAQKNFKKKLEEDEGFRKVFQDISFKALRASMSTPQQLESNKNSAIGGIMNAMQQRIIEDTSTEIIEDK